MGEFKPLLEINGKAAIIHLLETISQSDFPSATITDIAVVTGHNNEELSKVVSGFAEKNDIENKIHVAYNPNYIDGMFSSIKCGISSLFNNNKGQTPDAILLFPVDIPLISPETISRLIEALYSSEDCFIVPCFRGKKGHPLLIPTKYFDEIIDYDGEGGLKAITQKYSDKMLLLETEEETVVIDLDTPTDYSYLLRNFSGNDNDSHISQSVCQGKPSEAKLILLRHGSTEQHKEKIFMGQADIPLSDIGREEAKKAGVKLSGIELNNPKIWSSPLSRARETAEIVATELYGRKNSYSEDAEAHDNDDVIESFDAQDYVTSLDSLSEINLGEWDGRYISEIKELFPLEYEKRGENILDFKEGNESENFYDLRYRVTRALKEILSETGPDRDIIIVTHAGPIRILIADTTGIPLIDALKLKIPKTEPIQL